MMNKVIKKQRGILCDITNQPPLLLFYVLVWLERPQSGRLELPRTSPRWR